MNRHARRPTRVRAHSHAGFSMMEVLVAIGIFALGFVAVAAIFPSAALMQRGTAEDVQARHMQRNAEAIIKGMAASGSELEDALEDGYDDDETTVKPFPPSSLEDGNPSALWNLNARSFPTHIINPTRRSTYWVPLRRNANPEEDEYEWRIYVFVLNRQSGNYIRENESETDWEDHWANPNDGYDADENTWTVPGVRRMQIEIDDSGDDSFTFADEDINDSDILPNPTNLLRVNDPLLYKRNGQTYRVTAIDPDDGRVTLNGTLTTDGDDEYIWIGYGGRDTEDNDEIDSYHRPTKRIFTLTDVVADD